MMREGRKVVSHTPPPSRDPSRMNASEVPVGSTEPAPAPAPQYATATSGWVVENACPTRAATSTGTEDARQAAGRDSGEEVADAPELDDEAGEHERVGKTEVCVVVVVAGPRDGPAAAVGAAAAEVVGWVPDPHPSTSPASAATAAAVVVVVVSASTHRRRRRPALAPPKSL